MPPVLEIYPQQRKLLAKLGQNYQEMLRHLEHRRAQI
jgi:hypothetical protein